MDETAFADAGYAAHVVKYLLANYPTQRANDPDVYSQQLTVALTGKGKSTLRDLVHPVNGIVAECKFLPTLAEIAAWFKRRNQPLSPYKVLPPDPPMPPKSDAEKARAEEMVRKFKQQAAIAANAMRVR
jgi:hypothetical protein